ncbi:MAG TPA: hypothetical protein VMU11_02435 [Verrucomicrobiae bacterium]|nr:hypothetical protein [Verrucomicrobiae bacterium]
MDDWTPPELAELTGEWTVEPSLSAQYYSFAKNGSAVLRAAALGLVYERFKPATKADQRKYARLIAGHPEREIQMAVMRLYHQLPAAFLDRLVAETHREVERMLDWLNRIEGEGYPGYEVRAWLLAFMTLEYANNALRVHGLYVQVNGGMKHLNHERKKRLPA